MRGGLFVVLGLLGVLLGLGLLLWGSVSLPLESLLGVIGDPSGSDQLVRKILLELRLPKLAVAVMAGASLALAGLLMQTLFSNPLAGPDVLGISAGASLGVALLVLASGGTVVLGLAGSYGLAGAATLGAFLMLLVVMAFSEKVGDPTTLLILGLIFGAMAGGMVSILIYFSEPDQIQSYLLWTFGSFRGLSMEQLWVMASLLLPGLLLAVFLAKPLNALLMGEGYAASMGVEVQGLRRRLLFSASLLAGGVTAFCGPIAFLGIAVPHLARLLFKTADHKVLIPACLLVGADLGMFAELVAGLPGSALALPINAVLSMVGAPVVFWVVLGRSK